MNQDLNGHLQVLCNALSNLLNDETISSDDAARLVVWCWMHAALGDRCAHEHTLRPGHAHRVWPGARSGRAFVYHCDLHGTRWTTGWSDDLVNSVSWLADAAASAKAAQ